MPSLAVRDLTVRFGAVLAVDRLSFDLEPGQLTGLIGPNGAGKTTVLDACTGFVPCSGEVRLGDQRVDALPAHRRVRLGVVRTFQSLDVLDDLTVAENVASGLIARRGRAVDGPRPERATAVADALELVGAGGLAARFPAQISQGQRALVALARALAGAPHVLLLDEPAAGLDTAESAALGAVLTALVAETQVSVVLVEHDMGLVLSTCDRVLVLDGGRLLSSGTPDEIRADPAVLDAYLGVPTADPIEDPSEDPREDSA